MKILCFGDSNTYGYDPRGYLTDRYPDENCWTTHLSDSGYQTLNYGMNGREIPHRPMEVDAAIRVFTAEKADLLLIMLGSNDLLMHSAYRAENVATRMDAFLQTIRLALPEQAILLLSPVQMASGTWVQEDRLLRESARLGTLYALLAKKHRIAFADASQWNISLTFDGVHFSETGHRCFSSSLLDWLKAAKYI